MSARECARVWQCKSRLGKFPHGNVKPLMRVRVAVRVMLRVGYLYCLIIIFLSVVILYTNADLGVCVGVFLVDYVYMCVYARMYAYNPN